MCICVCFTCEYAFMHACILCIHTCNTDAHKFIRACMCLYACIHVRMGAFTYVWAHSRTYGRIHVRCSLGRRTRLLQVCLGCFSACAGGLCSSRCMFSNMFEYMISVGRMIACKFMDVCIYVCLYECKTIHMRTNALRASSRMAADFHPHSTPSILSCKQIRVKVHKHAS